MNSSATLQLTGHLLHDFSLILTEREDIPGRFPGSDPLRASKLLGTKLVRERDGERESARAQPKESGLGKPAGICSG